MILAIDGYEANVASRVGIGRFAYELLVRIEKAVREGKTSFSSVRVYLPNAPLPDMPKASRAWEYRVLSPKQFWTIFRLPIALRRDKPFADVVFSPTHYVPRFVPIPRVMAIMDTSYLLYPELFRPADLHKLVHWTAYSAGVASRIITISEYSKRAIIKAYNVANNQVQVVYPGLVQTSSKLTAMKDDVTKKYDISSRFILSVGTLQPRKNFTKLIEAFSQISDKEIDLVIVGKKGWLYEEILQAPKTYGVEGRVKFLEFVPDEDLPALYTQAQCFVLPSLYEGFGLPVLEAMAHSCPVVTSNVSSLPEIAGDAALYIDPENLQSITDGIVLALSQKGTEKEKKRIAEGLKRVKLFTWDKAATDVISLLEQVGKKEGIV
ncbi:glycosyltransferase family 4 protein [Candidatus Woesebacteria bacterium]|nr:glycosyltransferase family 4 protein [Candidatus Woesebacteria bacterium]